MTDNVRVLFPEDLGIGQRQDMLADRGLAVHNARGDLRAATYHIAIQDLHLSELHFGNGGTYNQALTDACNQALRYRDWVLKKRA